jgi:Aldo/keto reductase family
MQTTSLPRFVRRHWAVSDHGPASPRPLLVTPTTLSFTAGGLVQNLAVGDPSYRDVGQSSARSIFAPHHRRPAPLTVLGPFGSIGLATNNMHSRKLGTLKVAELGFGILSFTSTYGQAPEKAESIRVIRGAHDLGVTLFDTAEAYGPWTNEALLGEALAPVRNEVVIATKFGLTLIQRRANVADSIASRSTSSV